MTSASQAQGKWKLRAASASEDFVVGAQSTQKDQAASAIAAEGIYQQQLTASFAKKSFSKGLQKSGKAGWLRGIVEKGGSNYSTGVSTDAAASNYSQNSGKFDAARNAAEGTPRLAKGNPANLQRVNKVVAALLAVKAAS